MFEDLFRRRYLESLGYYKSFYDDIHEYGSQARAGRVFYFLPGLNGTPGQIRFIFPSLFRKYGPDIYVRCCYLPEFSAARPIWEKFTIDNIERKRAVIIDDLSELLGRHGDVTVITSSSAFYEFLHAYEGVRQAARGRTLRLVWSACAPDRYLDSPWEAVFFPLNGFVHNGHRWAAVPNHNLLKYMHPETSTSFRWTYGRQKKTFFKIDLESRFVCFNLYWDYISISCFNEMQGHLLRDAPAPIDIEAHVLAAANDGYWQGRGRDEVTAVLDRYLARKTVLFRDGSHLWVNTPENITEILNRLGGDG